MTPAVLDASVFVSACSPSEIRHEVALAMIESVPPDRPFLVPALFHIEVVSALSRRREPSFLVDAAEALVTGPRFHSCPLDESLVRRSVEVARRAGCRAYDAVYAALALTHGAILLTFDEELKKLLRGAFPKEILLI